MNPTRSANRTDTRRRSETADGTTTFAGAGAPVSDAPHCRQNRAPGTIGSPQFGQDWIVEAPQWMQNLPAAGVISPQAVQRISAVALTRSPRAPPPPRSRDGLEFLIDLLEPPAGAELLVDRSRLAERAAIVAPAGTLQQRTSELRLRADVAQQRLGFDLRL